MAEKIHQLLCSLAILCLHSERPLSSKILDQIGGLAEHVHSISRVAVIDRCLGRFKEYTDVSVPSRNSAKSNVFSNKVKLRLNLRHAKQS